MSKVAASFVFIFFASTIISCAPNRTASNGGYSSGKSKGNSYKCPAFQEPAASSRDAYIIKKSE